MLGTLLLTLRELGGKDSIMNVNGFARCLRRLSMVLIGLLSCQKENSTGEVKPNVYDQSNGGCISSENEIRICKKEVKELKQRQAELEESQKELKEIKLHEAELEKFYWDLANQKVELSSPRQIECFEKLSRLINRNKPIKAEAWRNLNSILFRIKESSEVWQDGFHYFSLNQQRIIKSPTNALYVIMFCWKRDRVELQGLFGEDEGNVLFSISLDDLKPCFDGGKFKCK